MATCFLINWQVDSGHISENIYINQMHTGGHLKMILPQYLLNIYFDKSLHQELGQRKDALIICITLHVTLGQAANFSETPAFSSYKTRVYSFNKSL